MQILEFSEFWDFYCNLYVRIFFLIFFIRHLKLLESANKSPESKEIRKSAVDSPQLTFQPIDMDLMGDLHELIYRRCSLCNDSPQKRTSASDSQLIDLMVCLFVRTKI